MAVLDRILKELTFSGFAKNYLVPKKGIVTSTRLYSRLLPTANNVCYRHLKSSKSPSLESLLEPTSKSKLPKNTAKVHYDLFIPIESEFDRYSVNVISTKNVQTRSIFATKEENSIDLAIKDEGNNPEYKVSIEYDPSKKGYHVHYESDYMGNLEVTRQDFTNRLDKSLELLPKSIMGGVLGFTYIGSGKMTRRDDLFGEMALMVDVHEAIHTPDEYETRVLTDWIINTKKPKYKSNLPS